MSQGSGSDSDPSDDNLAEEELVKIVPVKAHKELKLCTPIHS